MYYGMINNTMKQTDKHLYIENLGCAKNQVDAEVMACSLAKDGWKLTENADEANLIIVNTCGFIEDAKKQSIETFFALKNAHPDTKIILSGCLAQRYSQNLEEELEEADAIFGNYDLSKINEVVKSVEEKKRTVVCPEYPDPEKEIFERTEFFNYPGSAYLKLSEGCNHCCAYCAIPVIRGPLRSRPQNKILEEVKTLADKGIKEINLIAQDLAAYGWDWDNKSHFVELLRKITSVEGNFKVRLLYIHPDWMTDEIIEEVKNNPKILHYFDIPFQHAAEKVLKPMKRTGNQDSYAKLVEKIRKEIPDAAIRTTIMLGFPTDDEECFEVVRNFIKRCKFTWMGSFVYSLEEDTPAYDMTTEEEHKKLAVKASQWQKKLEKLQQKITEKELENLVGKTLDVLIEENIEEEDLSIGRIYAQAPEVDGLTVVMGRNMVPGNVYSCTITKVNGFDLEAVKVGNAD